MMIKVADSASSKETWTLTLVLNHGTQSHSLELLAKDICSKINFKSFMIKRNDVRRQLILQANDEPQLDQLQFTSTMDSQPIILSAALIRNGIRAVPVFKYRKVTFDLDTTCILPKAKRLRLNDDDDEPCRNAVMKTSSYIPAYVQRPDFEVYSEKDEKCSSFDLPSLANTTEDWCGQFKSNTHSLHSSSSLYVKSTMPVATWIQCLASPAGDTATGNTYATNEINEETGKSQLLHGRYVCPSSASIEPELPADVFELKTPACGMRELDDARESPETPTPDELRYFPRVPATCDAACETREDIQERRSIEIGYVFDLIARVNDKMPVKSVKLFGSDIDAEMYICYVEEES